jgi:hypothetical protein
LLGLALLLMLHALFLLLHHCIEFFLLIVIQRATDLGDSAFANGVYLLDLLIAGHAVVLHHGHGLGMLVFKRGLYLRLLVGGKIQLLRQGLHLIVNARASGSRWALRLGGCAGLLARLRVLILSRLRWLS